MPKQRNLAIDRFRGLTIIVMVIVNDLAGVEGIPAILKHAPDEAGLTIADLVSKFFIFAIAATYAMSFNKRAVAAGKGQAYYHFFSRYLAILGVGAVFGTFEAVVEGTGIVWSTLHTIGLAGLLTLLVIRFHWGARMAVGAALLAAYQLTFQFANGLFVGDIGKMLEAIPMAACLMISTAMIDLFNKGYKPFLIGTGVVTILAYAPLLLPWVNVTRRNQVTYILICVSAACIFYLLLDLLTKKALPKKPGLLCWWGENPMLMYIFHLMLTGMALALDPRPLWLAIPVNLAILSILSVIAWAMHRKDWQFKF